MWSLTDASPGRLHEIAHEIEGSGRWSSFLTPQEHQLFLVALHHNEETWSRFLRGKIPCQLRFAGGEDGSVANTDVDPVTLAFRVRYMLWESLIDDANVEPSPVNNAAMSPAQGAAPDTVATGSSNANGSAAHAQSDADNDYDDYDDDEDDDVNSKNGVSQEPLEVLVADTKQEDSEPDARGRMGAVLNSSKMYDTFEFDVEQMKRFQRLKDSDEQIQRDGNDDDPSLSSEYTNIANDNKGSDGLSNSSSLAAFAKTAQFGSANLCLKHLLTTIESKRSEIQVTDIELRNLISDVRKNRSKWASEERIGQEELYEACERVVQELRANTEHSTAFLNKVSKREAPNYYDIIKKPMDLNTVMRKLRALQYNSKSEFVDDLNLIWSNCLTYNSEPTHFLRAHAIAMRKKTQALAPLIPDVTIRSRAEVEAEAEMLERQAQEQRKRRGSDSESGHGSKRKIGVAPMKSHDANGSEERNGRRNSDESETPKPASDSEVPGSAADSLAASNAAGTAASGNAMEVDDAATGPDAEDTKPGHIAEINDAGEDENKPNSEYATDAENEAPASASEPIEEEEYRVPDVESSFWTSATRRRRIECISVRQGMFSKNKLQMEAPITVRTPGSMLRFDKTIRGEDLASQISGISLLSTDPGEEPFMIEYEASAGIPQSPASDNSAWLSAPIPKLQELPPSKYMSRGLITDLVNRNLNEMQIIRRLCAKILYIKDLQSGQLPYQHETSGGPGAIGGSASDYPSVKDPEEDISSRLPGSARYDMRASYFALHRTVAKVAMQAGFETAQPRAVDVLTSIAGEYMTKLGETLVANLEAPNSSSSFSSILSGSLETMGILRLSHLTKYISDDVLRQGRRLSTFRLRLSSMLLDILRPEVEKYQDDQFQDNSEQFVLGQFSNELGDDYFGFKELGINEELGLSNITVPFHLLQQRAAFQDSGIAQRGTRRKLGLDVPEYPPLLPADIQQLPAIIRPAFEKILLKFKSPALPAPASTQPSSEQKSPSTASFSGVETKQPEESGESASAASGAEQPSQPEDPNINHIQQLATQAAHARAKVPTSGKLVPRKKRFDRAYVRAKPEPPKPEPAETEAESKPTPTEPPGSNSAEGDHNDDDKIGGSAEPDQVGEQEMSDPDADAELNNEIGSLAFDAEATPASNGFTFDDSMPTGSLMLQGDEEDEDDGMGDSVNDFGFDLMKR